MPSIEIVVVGQLQPIEVSRLPFAVLAGQEMQSHRSPHPRFQEDFDRLSGILYHLGNPNLKDDNAGRCFFAYDLLSEASRKAEATFLEFAPAFRSAAEALLAELAADSPVHQFIFTSDWQLGPDWTKREEPVALQEFWRLHDSRQIQLNALYPTRRM